MWSHKGPTLKGIRYCSHPDTELFFPAQGRIFFGQTSYSEYLTKEALEGFGDFTIGGKVILIVKHAENLVLLAKKETVLYGMIDRLMEIGRYYGMEMNLEKPTVMRISRQPSPIQITIHKKQLENVEYLNYLGSMITNDARCTRDVKSRTVMAKAALNTKTTLFTSKFV
jgi:hypothetical protein